jgi:Ca2+/H+ antiporter
LYLDGKGALQDVYKLVPRVVVFQINGDGETNWLEGVQLLSVYLILGILFFYLPERAHRG